MTTVEIPLSRGYVAIVDAEDAASVIAAGPWHAIPNRRIVYAGKSVARRGGGWTTLTLHSFLTGYELTDHVDCNGLNNTRANLRPATRSSNQWNRRMQRNNTSGFKGVSWVKNRRGWRARIQVDGEVRGLGLFREAEDAARAYDRAARELHGEFATVNFPRAGEQPAHREAS